MTLDWKLQTGLCLWKVEIGSYTVRHVGHHHNFLFCSNQPKSDFSPHVIKLMESWLLALRDAAFHQSSGIPRVSLQYRRDLPVTVLGQWVLLTHSEMPIGRACSVPPGLLTAASTHGATGWFQRPHFCRLSVRQLPLRPHCLPRAAPSRGAGYVSSAYRISAVSPLPRLEDTFLLSFITFKAIPLLPICLHISLPFARLMSKERKGRVSSSWFEKEKWKL